jgi:hypothetical protein
MPSRVSPSGFKALEETSMFQACTIGRLQLEHKVVLAPLTRMRAPKEADCVFYPGDLNVEYYSQRASKGGFILSEACPISRLVSSRYISRSQTKLTISRLPATLAYQAFSRKNRSKVGSASLTLSTQRAPSSTASCGMLVAPLRLLFSAARTLSVRATSPSPAMA